MKHDEKPTTDESPGSRKARKILTPLIEDFIRSRQPPEQTTLGQRWYERCREEAQKTWSISWPNWADLTDTMKESWERGAAINGRVG